MSNRSINAEAQEIREKATDQLTRGDLKRIGEIARMSGRLSDKLLFVSVKHAVQENEAAKNDND